MARIEILRNIHSSEPTLQNRKVIVQMDQVEGTHMTEMGELTITEALSPDGAQRALLLSGEAMRGHGKHVRRETRLVQMSIGGGQINLGLTKVLRVVEPILQ